MNNIQQIIIIVILFLAFKCFLNICNQGNLFNEPFTPLIITPNMITIPLGEKNTVQRPINKQTKKTKNEIRNLITNAQNNAKGTDSFKFSKVLLDSNGDEHDITAAKPLTLYKRMVKIYRDTRKKNAAQNKIINKQNEKEKEEERKTGVASKISTYGTQISDYDSRLTTIESKIDKIKMLRSDYEAPVVAGAITNDDIMTDDMIDNMTSDDDQDE